MPRVYSIYMYNVHVYLSAKISCSQLDCLYSSVSKQNRRTPWEMAKHARLILHVKVTLLFTALNLGWKPKDDSNFRRFGLLLGVEDTGYSDNRTQLRESIVFNCCLHSFVLLLPIFYINCVF